MMARTAPSTPTLRDAYRRVLDRVGEAAVRCGRRPQDVITIAVTKNASPDQIRLLVEMGHTDLGESRVQQLQQRAPAIHEWLARRKTLAGAVTKHTDTAATSVRWHMIGHLQRNKAKPVVPLVQLIHSVDSLRLAEELQALGARLDRTIDVLLQVNTSGEESKFGVASPAAPHLAEQIDTMVHLRLRGLMTMAPYSDNPEDARPTFARCAEMFHELRNDKRGGDAFTVLSMGMSGDFEVAIAEGANLVRIGRALFGETEQP
jgi:pyridoxal phosphate enzyme (YggS family)